MLLQTTRATKAASVSGAHAGARARRFGRRAASASAGARARARRLGHAERRYRSTWTVSTPQARSRATCGRRRSLVAGTGGCVRWCGLPSSSAGAPCSRIRPCVEEAHAVGDLAGERHLVGRDQHRHPVALEIADDVEHLADELGVERRRDLVEQHHLGLHRQRAGDRRRAAADRRSADRDTRRPCRPGQPLEQRERRRSGGRLVDARAPCAARARCCRRPSCAGTG